MAIRPARRAPAPDATPRASEAARPATAGEAAHAPAVAPAAAGASDEVRAEGFALLDRIRQAREAQSAGYTGDLDALESLVWRMLFLDREV